MQPSINQPLTESLAMGYINSYMLGWDTLERRPCPYYMLMLTASQNYRSLHSSDVRHAC
jgi:hypothetical protein